MPTPPGSLRKFSRLVLVALFFVGAVVFSNFFLLTLYVQQVLGWSALKTGVTFVATAGSAVLWAGLAQALVTKIGVKPVMTAGCRPAGRKRVAKNVMGTSTNAMMANTAE